MKNMHFAGDAIAGTVLFGFEIIVTRALK